MKKLLITTALCASIIPANADAQSATPNADAYAELVCDKMGTQVMDEYVISDEHLADANETRKDFADGCKKLFLMLKDGLITKDQLDTTLADAFKSYIKTMNGVLSKKRNPVRQIH